MVMVTDCDFINLSCIHEKLRRIAHLSFHLLFKAHLNERILRYNFAIFSLVLYYIFAFLYLPVLTGIYMAFFSIIFQVLFTERQNMS